MLERTGHPVGIVTKSALVVRDIDILAAMAKRGLAKVALSVTTLDSRIARAMEPRAPTPAKRLEAVRQLSEAGIPTAVMVAPIVPGLTDPEIERILEAARDAGATQAGYVLLRLPLEIKDPVPRMARNRVPRPRPARHPSVAVDARRARLRRGIRRAQRGRGPYAEQIGVRFRLAAKRLGLNRQRHALRTDLFQPPVLAGQQMRLF